MSITSKFDFDGDNDDIVKLENSTGETTCSGWVNVGDHAVWIQLQGDGSLKLETFAKGAEAVPLGALTIPSAAVLSVLREDMERSAIGHPMAPLVADLATLGFGTDDDINGADCVDAINRHFDRLRLYAAN